MWAKSAVQLARENGISDVALAILLHARALERPAATRRLDAFQRYIGSGFGGPIRSPFTCEMIEAWR